MQTTALASLQEWIDQAWETLEVLGEGHFGEVRLVVHPENGVRCAVKAVNKENFEEFRAKRGSQLTSGSEREVLSSLDHPGIVRLHGWHETDARLYVALELVEGGTVLESILERGRFPEAQASRLFRELCDAVRYLHARDVVHRDLKPENAMLTARNLENTGLRLVDFGLARRCPGPHACRTFCGSSLYVAPEVIHTSSGRSAGYGKGADVWSLGVVLYVMLSGVPPFEEDDGLYEQITTGKYEFDVWEWTAISLEAKELVRRLMTVDSAARVTMQKALEHGWLRPAPELPSRARGGA